MLRYGRAALAAQEVAARDVGPNGAEQGERTEAGVFVKRIVLDRDGGFLDVRGDLLERYRGAAHGAMHVVKHNISGAVEYLGRLRHLAILKIVDRRYRHDACPDDAAGQNQERRDGSDKETYLKPRRGAAYDISDTAEKAARNGHIFRPFYPVRGNQRKDYGDFSVV